MVRRISALFSLLVLLTCPALPQTAETRQENLATKAGDIKLEVDLVMMDAQVMQQKNGRVVGNLKRDDFLLFEDGVKQQITHFSQNTLPLSVILLVDRGGCLDPYNERVHKATLEALNLLKPDDEVALMAFSDNVELVQGFRTYKRSIGEALKRLPEHVEEAPHCFNRAFFEAADYMRRAANPDGRRVIIMVTALTRTFDCSGPSGDEVRNAVFESGSVVCGLIPTSAGQRFENGVLSGLAGIAGAFKAKTSSLKQLAEETGGEVLTAKQHLIDSAFNDLVAHLRTRYNIGFIASEGKVDGKFHKLRLEVAPEVQARDAKLVVKTRRGYVARRPAPGTVDSRTGKIEEKR
ncbi:MAG TPA: VWA domain-containing protein [Blastocatellia bacterium]|nr:VWA domain-containing protein [Blastocatellia bacterium]